MEINLTLLIQCINIGLIYVFLEKFFIRPLYKLIEQALAERQALVDAVDQAQRELEQKEALYAEHFRQFQQDLQRHIPSLVMAPLPSMEDVPLAIGSFSDEQDIDKAYEYLVKRLQNV